MSRLMRMAYGHGGTRLERTLVSGHHQEPAPSPLRLKLLLCALWIIVPVLVSLYGIPATSLPMKTVIDISQLSVKPPPEPGKTVFSEPKPVPPVEQTIEPPPKPVTTAEQTVEPPRVRQALVPQAEDVKRPAIARTSPADLPDLAEQKLQAARERKRVDAEMELTPLHRLRRGAVPSEAPSERTAVSRSRGVVSLDEPGTRDRVATVRRQTVSESPVAGFGVQQQRIAKKERVFSQVEENVPRAASTRERASAAGGVAGSSLPSAGLIRGVSLMSLEICSGSQQQEEAIKAVLSVVGSRNSCTNDKGEFQFKGTKRISSFNLMIFPSKGRRLSNRCEELEDAYHCLKNH